MEDRDLLTSGAKYIVKGSNFTDDLGMLYGKGGLCLYLFLYSHHLDYTFKSKAHALLKRIFNSFSSDVSKHFIHTPSLGFLLDYLRRNNMLPNGSFDFSEEIDAFLLDVIVEQDNIQKSCDIFTTLNYLNMRIKQSLVSEPTRNHFKLATEHLILKANMIYTNQLESADFWNSRRSLSYYEYNYDVHNYFNYLELIARYASLCESTGVPKLVMDTLSRAFEVLKGRAFINEGLSEVFCEALSLKQSLQILQSFVTIEPYTGADLSDKCHLLYRYIKSNFRELLGDASIHEMLQIIKLLRKLTLIYKFDFTGEVTNLITKLRILVRSSHSVGLYHRNGLADLGLANGLSGILITLMGNELNFDEDWDAFLFIN